MPDGTQIEEKAKQFMNVRTLILTTILSALGFVLALFWNDAIKTSIESLLPPAQTVTAKFMVAWMVTVIIIFVVYIIVQLNKLTEKHIIQELKKIQKEEDEHIKEVVKQEIKDKKKKG
ncbi:MAG: hypothetical protein HY513_04000 [Candidatus Aenigmarchaeota archaeon]|nr:hypothetical protein [Candidatus Aenigmarchaeota archaeon]